jgi:hypothetical protein
MRLVGRERQTVRERFRTIVKLYDLVRSRPTVTQHLERNERVTEEWVDLMKKNPAFR